MLVVNGCTASSSRPLLKSKPSCSATVRLKRRCASIGKWPHSASTRRDAAACRARSRSTSGSKPARSSANSGIERRRRHAGLVAFEQDVVGRPRAHRWPRRRAVRCRRCARETEPGRRSRCRAAPRSTRRAPVRVQRRALAHQLDVERALAIEPPLGLAHVDRLLRRRAAPAGRPGRRPDRGSAGRSAARAARAASAPICRARLSTAPAGMKVS